MTETVRPDGNPHENRYDDDELSYDNDEHLNDVRGTSLPYHEPPGRGEMTRQDGFTTHDGAIDLGGRIGHGGETSRAAVLLREQTRVLEKIARGEDLGVLLEGIARLGDQWVEDACFSIHLLDESRCLRLGAAPGLPAGLRHQIDGISIGPNAGSFGAAAFRAEPVFVDDVADHPLWENYRFLVLQYQLRSCWSIPIVSRHGTVLGTASLYRRNNRKPGPDDLRVLESVAGMAGIAIERQRYETALSRKAMQQAVVSELGLKALAGAGLSEVMDETARQVAATLEVEYCKVLELLPEEGMLLFRAGVGWREGWIGRKKVGAGKESQAGYTLLQRKPVIVRDLRSETRFRDPHLLRDHDVTSGISVVILGENGPWGIMGAHASRERDFNEDDIHFFQAVANVLAAAIAKEKLIDRLREETRVVATINEVGQTLAVELDIDVLLQRTTDAATEICGAQYGALFHDFADDTGIRYSRYTLSGTAREAFGHLPPPGNTPLLGPAFRGETTVRIDDVRSDPRYGLGKRFSGLPENHPPVASFLAVPVTSRSGAAIGCILFGHEKPGVFTERHERIAEGIAAQAAIALDNARLYRQARETGNRLESQQEALRRQADELLEQDRAKNEFLAMLSHELRNPLAPMLNAVHMLSMTPMEDPRLVEACASMHRQVKLMSRLVDDLLDVSRITRGIISLTKEPVDLRDVVNNAVQSSRMLLEERGHRFTVSLPDVSIVTLGDPTRLEQTLTNLLNNAVRYTPPGGSIDVTLRRNGSHAELRIRDTGRGIPADMLARIFDLFTQVEPAIDRSLGGLGLGLTLARKIIDSHGGSIEAESEGPDRGSVFTVRLPLFDGKPCRDRDDSACRPKTPDRAGRLLVVDDNRDAASTLTSLLEMSGYTVSVAHDGNDAIRLATHESPDIVLLDIGLPGLDGYEVARRLRSHPATSSAKLVAITGYGQEHDQHRAKTAGFHAHLTKPVEPSRLLFLIDDLIAEDA